MSYLNEDEKVFVSSSQFQYDNRPWRQGCGHAKVLDYLKIKFGVMLE